jgi:long-chain acyl-CoA synthetase
MHAIREALEGWDTPAIVPVDGPAVTGEQLLTLADRVGARLDETGVGPGDRVVLIADYSPVSVALLLALADRRTVVAPLLPGTLATSPGLLDIIDAEYVVQAAGDADLVMVSERPSGSAPVLIDQLRARDAAGLVVLTSGSSGSPKAVVHDLGALLRRYETPRPSLRTVLFLLFDHLGGLNTLFHSLANRSPSVALADRSPDHVCARVAAHGAELLPVTPSFLRMMLLSQAHHRHDLSSLAVISYGAEPMPASTLRALHAAFPGVDLRQTYGMIEIGALRAKSESNESLWVRLGGEGVDLRVVDGVLQVRSPSTMLGYLNADAPFTSDGFLITGDRVEQRGPYVRFLGRDSDIINVGGEKVYPSEVESALLDVPGVVDAVVRGEPNAILGSIVVADVVAGPGGDHEALEGAVALHCRRHLARYKIPVKVRFVPALTGDRLKKRRV